MGKENPQRKTHLIFSRTFQKNLNLTLLFLQTRTSSMTTTMNLYTTTFESDIVSDIDIFSEDVGVSATTTEIPSFWQMHMSELSERDAGVTIAPRDSLYSDEDFPEDFDEILQSHYDFEVEDDLDSEMWNLVQTRVEMVSELNTVAF